MNLSLFHILLLFFCSNTFLSAMEKESQGQKRSFEEVLPLQVSKKPKISTQEHDLITQIVKEASTFIDATNKVKRFIQENMEYKNLFASHEFTLEFLKESSKKFHISVLQAAENMKTTTAQEIAQKLGQQVNDVLDTYKGIDKINTLVKNFRLFEHIPPFLLKEIPKEPVEIYKDRIKKYLTRELFIDDYLFTYVPDEVVRISSLSLFQVSPQMLAIRFDKLIQGNTINLLKLWLDAGFYDYATVKNDIWNKCIDYANVDIIKILLEYRFNYNINIGSGLPKSPLDKVINTYSLAIISPDQKPIRQEKIKNLHQILDLLRNAGALSYYEFSQN